MQVITKEDITAKFAGKDMIGGHIIDALTELIKEKVGAEEVLVPFPTIRYFGKETITEASIATLRSLVEGVGPRLPQLFPKGVEEVHIFCGQELSDYVVLIQTPGGGYKLKSEQ